uniref:Uncharacterized protein n=1 Tax=Aegilops tauschii subsp. strangulata TaxID=200361 RepID=A0A453SE44_AEGTS
EREGRARDSAGALRLAESTMPLYNFFLILTSD